MSGWKDLLNANAIQPVQQFAYTKGKNSTDSALIIDAMDILPAAWWTPSASSSDSDYTCLHPALARPALFVMGVGEKDPRCVRAACEALHLRREPRRS